MAGGSSLQKLRDDPAGEGSLTDGWFKLTSGHWPSHATRSSGARGAPRRGIFKATGPLVTSPAAMQGAAKWPGVEKQPPAASSASASPIRLPLTILAQFALPRDRHLVPLTMWVRRYDWLGFGAAAYARGIAPTKPPDPSQTL